MAARGGGGAAVLGIFQAANREFEEDEAAPPPRPRNARSPTTGDTHLQLPPNASSPVPPNPLCLELRATKQPAVPQSYPLGEDQLPSSALEVIMAVEDIKRFMKNFDLDLADVTQALLKNSGEVTAVTSYLLTGQRLDGCPLWTRQDDVDLFKGEEKLRSKLVAKYGAESVTRRMAFRTS